MNVLLQRFAPVRFFTPFALVILLFCGTGWLTATGALPAFFRSEGQTEVSHPAAAELTFAERVSYQRIIEDVYWRHRIWPKENPDPKPLLDAVMSQAQLENKVRGYLRDSLVLEDYWQTPITAEQLQAEMDRMARDTKQPENLRELFEALGNDPDIIAECLARPILAEHLITDLSMQDRNLAFESSRANGLHPTPAVTTLGHFAYTLPNVAEAGDPPCIDDTWTATNTTNAPTRRMGHTAVWTGSEMIVWGGWIDGANEFNTGARYNPVTDNWTATSTNGAPEPRGNHTAVWSGTEMIVWGGDDGGPFNTGGRYNPGADSWVATSTTNAPEQRVQHTAVWSGTEMIVWGGYDRDFQGHLVALYTGGKYNPGTNSWTATSTVNVPSARAGHTAVWTGTEMISMERMAPFQAPVVDTIRARIAG